MTPRSAMPTVELKVEAKLYLRDGTINNWSNISLFGDGPIVFEHNDIAELRLTYMMLLRNYLIQDIFNRTGRQVQRVEFKRVKHRWFNETLKSETNDDAGSRYGEAQLY